MAKTTKLKKSGRGVVELEIFNGQPIVVINMNGRIACISCHDWSLLQAGKALGLEVVNKELPLEGQRKLEL